MSSASFFCLAFSPFISTVVVAAQQADADFWSLVVSFRPSVTIVIDVFSLMFSLTFLLLIYAKFCHSAATACSFSSYLFSPNAIGNGLFHLPGQHRFSGIDKSIIESLPFFHFSSLSGVRDGLECTVYLS